VCALVGLLTGCGGGASTASNAEHASTSTSANATVSLGVRLQEAIVACKKQIAASPYIPASAQAGAEADCNGIRTGNVSALRAIVRKACEQEVIAKVPAAEQPGALTACKKVY
jgi:hypothetical protein